MKILFLMLAFPDLNTSSNLYTDLVEEFAKQQHEIYVVAPTQNEKEKTHINVEKNINILRVQTKGLFSASMIRKGIANILLSHQYKKSINKYYDGVAFDLIVMPTPPITLVNIAVSLQKKYDSKLYLILRDIFPQNAVDLGLMKRGGIIYNYFRRLEKRLYSQSDLIGCMSDGNIDHIMKYNSFLNREKLHVLMNFQKKHAMIGDESIKAKYGLENKFIVMFGGNMGIPQKLENVLTLAKSCDNDYDDVVFLLVGKGTQRKTIEKFVDRERISNIMFLDLMPRFDYDQLVAQCDVGLISLNEKFTIPNIPSKTMAYFEASIPVLASIDRSTDYGKILVEHNAGLYSFAGDLKGFRENFDKLYHDPKLRIEMGKNGKKFFEENMTTEVAYKTIMRNVQTLF